MTVRTTLALAASLALSLTATACKKSKPGDQGGGEPAGSAGATAAGSGAATGSGSGGGAAPTAPRASQGDLPGLEALPASTDPQHDAKVALGAALFFEPKLSVDGTRACYSCHQNADGNGGHDPIAIGAGDKTLTRHSPVIWNVAYYEKQAALYWDGRAKTLDELTKAAWGGGNMGVGTEPEKLDAKAAEVAKLPAYAKAFKAAFPDAKEIKADQVAAALAEYQRTLICKDTAYDKYAAGDKAALTESQQRGLDVFMGKGQCMVCHAPPYFSTAMAAQGGFYQNVGIGTQKPNEADVDIGRKKVSGADADWAAFKAPSLRNIARSAPYFHDGSVAKLEDAVKIMATGGIANKNKSALLQDRGLTAEEMTDLVAFLGALDCGELAEPAGQGSGKTP